MSNSHVLSLLSNKQTNQQHRYFNKFKYGNFKAELFDPVLVPYSFHEKDLYRSVVKNGQVWIGVRIAFISMDERLLAFKSERYGVAQPSYRYVYLPQEKFIPVEKFKVGVSPFAKLTLCRFLLSDKPFSEGQKSEHYPFFPKDHPKRCYTNLELIYCDTQERYHKGRMYGLDVIRDNFKTYIDQINKR